MATQVGTLSGFQQEVACDIESVCLLVHSPMFTFFFALPRSEGFEYSCVPCWLGNSLGVCLPTLSTTSAGYRETLLVVRVLVGSAHSLQASEAVVS